MSHLAILSLLLIAFLLLYDWVIKKRRIAVRDGISDNEFLESYRGKGPTEDDARILEIRQRVARELSLPASKISPEDRLIELRDRYCLVVSGHLALGDLYDDLQLEALKPDNCQALSPETVGEYITAACALESLTIE